MRIDILEFLGPAGSEWRRLLSRRRYRRDEALFREGDPSDTIHIIEKGRVLVQVSTAGGDTATLGVRGPGDLLGELSIEPGARRTASVIALEPTETLSMTHRDLEDLRRRDPRVDRFLVDLLADKLAESTQQLMEVLFVPVEKRVLRVLVRLAHLFGPDGGPTTVLIRQEDLASMVGSRRQTVNKPLKDAEAAGALRIGRGRVHVDDRDLLARLAGI